MEDAIVVRPASAQDAGVIFSFVAGLIEDHLPGQAPWTSAERIREDGFGPDPLFEVLIAERDAKPVGFVSFFRGYTGWRGKPMGIVHALYVRPEERRTGAARELMANVARIALERGWAARPSASTRRSACAISGMHMRLEGDALERLASGA
jgi:GNAT superfamily N-acetyltransferase